MATLLIAGGALWPMPASAGGQLQAGSPLSDWHGKGRALEHPRGLVPRVARGQAAQAAQVAPNNPWCKTMCTPPLVFTAGDPVIGGLTAMPGSATISAVYWAPSGYQYTATYRSIIDQYLNDVALVAGQPGNDFAQTQQYYQQSLAPGAAIQRIHPKVQIGNETADSNGYPSADPNSCQVTGFAVCLTDAELQAELIKLGLQADDAHLYVVLLPQGVATCLLAGSPSINNPCSNSSGGFCAYHSGTLVGPNQNILLYTNEPFPDLQHCVDPVNGAQSPNGDAGADAQISLISHEVNEAMTDWSGAWMDKTGSENGDECAYVYGVVQGAMGSFYNQTLGIHHYYTQDEFSNEDYAHGVGDPTQFNGQTVTVAGCTQGEELPSASFTGPASIATGTTASFDASASADPDSAGGLSYSWNWADGSAAGGGLTATHTYCTAGSYKVTLNVKDVDDWQNTFSAPISVTQSPPIVASVTPDFGPVGGGTAITITGCGFTLSSTVSFGSAPAASASVVSDRQIVATAPAAAAGTVDVRVANAAGMSATSSVDNFSYQVACPTGIQGSPIAGDFEGAGHADVALTTSSDVCVLHAGSGKFLPSALWSSVPFYGSLETVAGDVSGDGKADLVAVNSGNTWVLPSDGESFGAPVQWSNIAFYGTIGTFIADVNGDHKADLIAVNADSVWVMLSTGTGFSPPAEWSGVRFYGAVTTLFGDVNGDGNADLIAVNRDTTWVMTSNGAGFAAPVEWATQPFYGARSTFVADVTGDGKADLVALNNGDIWILTSNGSAFAAPAQWSTTPFYGSITTLPADVNGDKKQDLVAFNGSTVWIELSTGAAFDSPVQWL